MDFGILQTILALPITLRQRRLAKQRPPMGERYFVEEIKRAGGDAEASILIRNHLLEWIYAPGFTPYPEDKFGYTYGIREEELDDDLILMVLQHLNIRPSTIEELAPFGVVDTPIQVAQLVKRARLK
jgi:hypothetical protein